MKHILFSLVLSFAVGTTTSATAQSDEVQQLLLNVEKLAQFKQILSDLKKGYQVLKTGYNTIKDLSQGTFSLHKIFLDGLLQVSPAIRNYKRVADIIQYQLVLVKEYKHVFNRFKKDNNFNARELKYIARVYDNLFRQSLRNIDDLVTIVTANKLRMSDDERIKAIDDVFANMQDKVIFLRQFNNNTTILALQRAKERNDAINMRNIYGINH
jgi:DNA repair ATPase RecN